MINMYGRRGWNRRWTRIAAPSGYTYIGPCRCGTGPHAFYHDKSGRIVHASQLYLGEVPLPPENDELISELETLKEEKAQLEKRIEELEKKLKEKE